MLLNNPLFVSLAVVTAVLLIREATSASRECRRARRERLARDAASL